MGKSYIDRKRERARLLARTELDPKDLEVTPRPPRAKTMRGLPLARQKGIKGVGRGKKKNVKPRVPWSKLLEATHEVKATDVHRSLAAKAMGVNTLHVPKGMTVGELMAHVTNALAIGGDANALNAVLDRVAPKPKRIEIDMSNTPKRAPVDAENEPGAQEAEDYMRELDGGE